MPVFGPSSNGRTPGPFSADLGALVDFDLDALLGQQSPFRPSRDVLFQGVNKTVEFDRILSLPRRAEAIDPAELDALTAFLKTDQIRSWDAIRASPPTHWRSLLPEGALHDVDEAERPQRLRPIQARALKDAYERGGLFAPIGVGHGKFLISVLTCMLVSSARVRRGQHPGRWLLFVPANLLEQTHRELAKARRHWRVPQQWPAGIADIQIRVESYEKLSSAKASKFLEEFEPTDIVCDEVHKLKRRSSARTRRFLRYFKDHPSTHLYAMSGSITRKSIRDYWHIIQLCLPGHAGGPALAPLPRTFPETEAWSQALDDAPDNDLRRAPGALLEFCDPDEIEALKPGWKAAPLEVKLGYYGETEEDQARLLAIVRRGFQRRLVETPGVVATSDGALGTSLVISERVPPEPPEKVREAFAQLRATWQDPNGDEIDSPISMWRIACQLSSGGWLKWIPAAPPEWLFARQEWNRFVRHVLAHNKQRLDSPLQVWQAVEAGKLSDRFGPGAELLEAWRNVRDDFEPNPVPQWIDTWLVEDALRWFDEQVDDDEGKSVPGIAWVSISAVGEAIERASGGRIPYFAGGPEASAAIIQHRGPCVASISAHGTGKNLQWASRNLVIHPPSGGDVWEQLLGRTHRPGQEADEVRVDFYAHALELREAFKSARRAARYVEDSSGQVQKLSYASVRMRGEDEIEARVAAGDPLWAK